LYMNQLPRTKTIFIIINIHIIYIVIIYYFLYILLSIYITFYI
jgi:hypothetical protein